MWAGRRGGAVRGNRGRDVPLLGAVVVAAGRGDLVVFPMVWLVHPSPAQLAHGVIPSLPGGLDAILLLFLIGLIGLIGTVEPGSFSSSSPASWTSGSPRAGSATSAPIWLITLRTYLIIAAALIILKVVQVAAFGLGGHPNSGTDALATARGPVVVATRPQITNPQPARLSTPASAS